MDYDGFHNHKWAKNLALALGYWKRGDYAKLWRGDQLSEHDFFPGVRVMSAYWASVEHEMPLRLSTFLHGAGHEDWLSDRSLVIRIVGRISVSLETKGPVSILGNGARRRPGLDDLVSVVYARRDVRGTLLLLRAGRVAVRMVAEKETFI